MSKVIHKPNFKSHLSLNSLLHRGQKSKDPYNKTYFNPARLLLKTLGTSGIFSPRCSRTFSSSDSKFNNYINNSKNLRIAGFSSTFILLVLSALSIYPIVRSLNSAEAVTPTNSTTSLSITSTNSASVELLVKSDSGTFATSTSSQKLNFNVKTDNYAGYELTLLGKDSTYNELKNSSTNTTLTSIFGSKESSEFSNGSWGYTLDGTNYLSAPDNETGYQIEKTSTPNKDTAKTYTLGIGAKANYSTKAGTYTNTYVLTAVGNSTPYTIYYKDNTGDSSVANLPTTQDEATSVINVNLSDTIPTRTGYTFLKWCDGTVTENGTKCSGTLYGASASFGIDRTAASNVATLYAVWTVNSYTLNITNNNTTSNPATSTTINFGGETTITVTPNAGYYLSEVSCPTGYTCSGYSTGSDATGAQTVTVKNNGDSTSATGETITFTAESSVDGYMQDFTASECSALSDGTTLKLGDKRDGNTYNVTKINGNCWMTQNLRYVGDAGSTSGSMIIKSSTSNISADTTISYGDLTEGNSYDVARLHVATSDQVPSGTSYTAADMGVWYNYAAASAMTITGSSNSTNATYDICPKNWRLFTSDERSTVTSYTTEFSPVTGGFYDRGSVYDAGYGRWWSATASGTTGRYFLRYNGSNLSTDYGDRDYGRYVRCIKKSATEELEGSYLQDITAAQAASLPTGTTLTMKDSRDEQSYTVQKLADGNLWMMNNLNLSATNVDLTSDNTNCYTSGSSTNCVASGLSNATLTKATFNAWKKSSGTGTYTAAELIPVDGTDSTSGTAYGTLYNYCATSAGTICSSSNSNDASYDICPKGWRLPTGNTSGEFQALYNNSSYNSNAKMRNPISSGGAAFALAGTFDSSTPTSQGSGGYYWSSTWYDTTNMYRLYLNTSGVDPAFINDRRYGFSIRCVLNDNRTIADATYMQDVTAEMVAATKDGATATLTDSRDNQTYTVAKINGNLWMTRNLAIGCNGSGSSYGSGVSSKTLTSSDSNISSTWSTPTEVLSIAANSSATSGYDIAAVQCSSSYGAWYNYAAASAGTITGESNKTAAPYDICPANWRMPTHDEALGIEGTTYKNIFIPVAGGFYDNGIVNNTNAGIWWSATASNNDARRLYLVFNMVESSRIVVGNNDLSRYRGTYVRCIRSS